MSNSVQLESDYVHLGGQRTLTNRFHWNRQSNHHLGAFCVGAYSLVPPISDLIDHSLHGFRVSPHTHCFGAYSLGRGHGFWIWPPTHCTGAYILGGSLQSRAMDSGSGHPLIAFGACILGAYKLGTHSLGPEILDLAAHFLLTVLGITVSCNRFRIWPPPYNIGAYSLRAYIGHYNLRACSLAPPISDLAMQTLALKRHCRRLFNVNIV